MGNQSNVLATVQGTWGGGNSSIGLVIGNQWYNPPSHPPDNSYWVVVLNLSNLQPVVNEVYTGNNQIPPGVQTYVGTPGYLLILTTYNLVTSSLPQGNFYAFLKGTGSGRLLDRAEQINEQLGTGTVGWMSYILVATLDQQDASGFEEFSFNNLTVLTFQLMPVQVNGQTVYAPIQP